MLLYFGFALVGLAITTYLCPIVLKKINNLLIFDPKPLEQFYYEKSLELKNENKLTEHNLVHNDGNVHMIMLNNNKKPDYSDTILIYSHGNTSNLGTLLKWNGLYELANKFTVCLYDYSTYGNSRNINGLSEQIMYNDIETVWNYLIKNGATADKIIIFGHSLGCTVSSYLGSKLVCNNIYPKALILEAGFSTLENIARDRHGCIKNFAIYSFNNMQNVKNIKHKIPVYIVHSPYDDIIKYYHAQILEAECNVKLFTVSGDHSYPIYTQEANEMLNNLTK